jgi:hypothetical protein
MSVPVTMPELTADEAAQSDRVVDCVRAEIAAQRGWIGFARYMQLVLYEPGLGYYSAGARKLGPAGDLPSPPDVRQCLRAPPQTSARRLRALDGGDLLEFGGASARCRDAAR